MDEDVIRERCRSILIRERAVEHDLTLTFVAALIREAYGEGYIDALNDPWADLEGAARATSAAFCRLPV
jgi:hypothetical protein